MAQNWKDKFIKILDGHMKLRHVTMQPFDSNEI